MNVFTSMWEITFDKYLRCCVDTACCLFAYVGSGLLRLAGYIAQLRSLTLPSSKRDKIRLSLSPFFFFFTILFLTVADWKDILTLDNGENHPTWHLLFITLPSLSFLSVLTPLVLIIELHV